MINRDKLIGMCAAHPRDMRTAMYKVISDTQDRPEVQLQAMGMALMATCKALDVDVNELLCAIDRMNADLDGPFVSTYLALTAYARAEIGSKF